MERTPTIDLTTDHESRLLALSPGLLAAAGLDGRLAVVNPGWSRALGRPAEDLVGSAFLELVHPEDAEPASRMLERLRAGGEVSGHACRLLHADGTERLVVFSGLGSTGDGCVYLAGEDVSDARRLEDELARRAEGLERVNNDLQEFAYIASHDLAEPLRMVTSYLELLERRYGEQLDDTAREFIGFAVGGAHRMRTLIDDLLTYSRVGSHELQHGAVDLAEVLGNVLLGLQRAISDAGARVSAPDTLAAVKGDATQIGQVLQNLIANAVKFRAPGRAPEVLVTSVPDGDGIRISVTDNGIGIDPAHHDRIFKMFARLHGRDEYEGTGIGLAVCRRITDRHGGRLWVESGVGGSEPGATFHAWFPGRP